ncbi:outer membrane receptor for ferrienterochelin and colicins [Desulfuromusa kysingii]|uniref:Outer membrane receptor for ferrienterochelin and colicins n=1 Tax=Desulfuromusa kysingii TaxID=37625 RepID=A0A1H3VSL1_9BACT|nr:TonB-dependent receptor [Desulfuromusa kysingii]SDZ77803.1 outer membrane receptor for ferrienterochelin and colicins [Desulfuromusa kysingii]
MKIAFKSAMLGLIAVTAICSHSLAAEPVPQTETMTVTAKSLQEIENLGVAVTIIDAEEILRSNATSINDVLVQSAGINLGVNSGSISGRQNISIRGSQSDHVLILVDGKKVSGSDAQIGHSDFQYNWVPMNAIERIEVIKGPASSIYGSQAIGGVVNIITKKQQETFSGDINTKFGFSDDDGGDLKNVSANIGGKISDRFSLFVSAEHTDLDVVADEENDSITKIEGKEITNGMVKLTFDLDSSQSLEASYSQGVEDRYEVGDTLYYDIDRRNYSLGYHKQFANLSLDIDAYVVDSDLHYNSSNSYTHNMTDSVARAEVSTLAFDKHFIVTGAEYKLEEYDKDYDLDASSGSNFKNEIYNTSAFIQDEIEVTDDLLITIGARYDYHEKFAGEWSPKMNVLYKLGSHHRIKAGYGEGFKAPTVTQNSSSYVSTSRHIFHGNDDLQPENSKSYEVGYEYHAEKTVFKAALYKTEVDNLIASEQIGSTASGGRIYQYANVNEAQMQGFELELTQDITADHNIRLGYQFLDTEDKSTGEDLSYRPKHSINARLISQLPWGLNATLSANYTGEQEASGEEYDAFTQYNLQLAKTFLDSLTARLGIDNLTDEDLDDSPYEIKGRLVYASINYRF